MLADVLATLQIMKSVLGIAVVTRDSQVKELALSQHARVFAETSTGVNAAINEATRILCSEGCTTMVVVPADVPLAAPTDFATVIAAQEGEVPAVTLVADRSGTGTNLLARSPPAAIPPRFGENSLAQHREAARRAGIVTTVLDLPNLRLDIDSPADLGFLVANGRRCQTTDYLRKILD
jgi:2-phospho-L-lactate guanylyltransferase